MHPPKYWRSAAVILTTAAMFTVCARDARKTLSHLNAMEDACAEHTAACDKQELGRLNGFAIHDVAGGLGGSLIVGGIALAFVRKREKMIGKEPYSEQTPEWTPDRVGKLVQALSDMESTLPSKTVIFRCHSEPLDVVKEKEYTAKTMLAEIRNKGWAASRLMGMLTSDAKSDQTTIEQSIDTFQVEVSRRVWNARKAARILH